MNLVYTAPPTIRQFMRDDSFFRVISGPYGSGKTTACIMEVVRRCIQQLPGADGMRRSRWAVVRNTNRQLKDTTVKDFLMWFPSGEAGRWKESEMTFFLEFADVRAEILFRALDTPDDIQRVLSLQLTGAFVDECREIAPEIIEALQGRLGRYPREEDVPNYWSGMICSTNPPEIDSWWYKVMEGFPVEEGDEGTIVPCASYKQPSGLSDQAENRDKLKPDYYERLARGKTQDWINTYIHGEYSQSLHGVPVFAKVFKHNRHVSSTPLPIDARLPVIIGVDFGRTPAMVFKQMRPNGRIFTLRELVEFDIGFDRFLKYKVRPFIANNFSTNPLVFIIDPAGKSQSQTRDESCYGMLKEEFYAEGAKVKLATTNDPDLRIQAVEKTLTLYPEGEPLLLIDPSCKWLIDAMRSRYRYANNKNPDFGHKPKPDKNNWSHVSDANQYADLFLMGGRYSASDFARVDVAPGFNPLGTFIDSRYRPALPQGY